MASPIITFEASMKREFITFENEQAWLDLRLKDITSTECSALFGCSPYATPYSLFHAKTGQLEADFELNDRIKWGNRLETAIAYGIAEDTGLRVEPFKIYARIPEMRMGSSFDFKIIGLDDSYTGTDETYRDAFRENGPGIMEVKNVDGLQFKRAWIVDEHIMEAPPHIELQVQHQQETADMEWTLIAPLVGGNMPSPFLRQRDRAIGRAIIDKVGEFWHMVDTGKAPAPDFSADGDTIAQLLYQDNGKTVDMGDNARLKELIALHEAAGKEYKTADEKKSALKAEILTVIGHNAKVLVPGFSISAGTTKDSAGTLITPAHIGLRMGGRSGYRMMRIYPKK
jgi:putative phage-type endonuclease